MGAQAQLSAQASSILSSTRPLSQPIPRSANFFDNMAENKALITQLEKAEKAAEDIIATAKKNRSTLLRQAKDKAEEESKVFKDEQESNFQKERGIKAKVTPAAEFEAASKNAVEQVNLDYAASKDKTVKFVAEKVLDVPLALTETQKQALLSGHA